MLASQDYTISIPKAKYHTESAWRALNEGLAGTVSGGLKWIADQIREVGPKHFILGTDFGVYTLPPPVEGMHGFIAFLLNPEF